MIRWFFFLSLLATSFSFAKGNYQNTLEELRIALNDVRQAYNMQRMDLELLQEELDKVKRCGNGGNKSFDERVNQLESTQQKILTDLRQLSGTSNQLAQSLSLLEKQIAHQNERLNEVVKLKSTLNNISKAIGSTTISGKTHKVQSGDTLEKIAKRYHTSIEALKRSNGLTSNTIIVGQTLRISE